MPFSNQIKTLENTGVVLIFIRNDTAQLHQQDALMTHFSATGIVWLVLVQKPALL